MANYYGIILPTYWTGPTGRAIRKRGGKDAQILGAYLFSNAHMNMIGLYKLTPVEVRSEIGLSLPTLQHAFEVMSEEHFAFYDLVSMTVFVREMARIRLNIIDEKPLARDDKKRIGAQKLYDHLYENPFLGLFFDRYHKVLQLKHRPEPKARGGVAESLHAPPQDIGHRSGIGSASKGLRRGFEGALKPVRSEVQDQRSGTTGTPDLSNSNDRTALRSSGLEKSSAAPAARFSKQPPEDPQGNLGVITKIAHEAIDTLGPLSNDLDDAVKGLCGSRGISYNSLVVGKAIESAIAQRKRAH